MDEQSVERERAITLVLKSKSNAPAALTLTFVNQANTMQVARHKRMPRKILALRASVLVAILLIPTCVVTLYFLPTQEDRAAENRLLGKWAMYEPGANLALPPDRVIEYLPRGQSADYSPELELWGCTSETPGVESTWHIRRGSLHSSIGNPSVFNGTFTVRYPMTWIDEDNFVLNVSSNGTTTPIHHRRITLAEVTHIRAVTNNTMDQSPQ